MYRISPEGVVDAVADGFTKPNGLAFSHDEKLLYVTDTGSSLGLVLIINTFLLYLNGSTLQNLSNSSMECLNSYSGELNKYFFKSTIEYFFTFFSFQNKR